MNIILSILSGVLLALSFPKFGWSWLAWIALAPFLIAISGPRKYLNAFCFAFVFFGINFSLVFSLWRFAGWWVLSSWLLLVFYQALFIIGFVFIYSKLCIKTAPISVPGAEIHSILQCRNAKATENNWKPNAFMLALIWVLVEIARSFGIFGITVGSLGYSQVHFTPLIQIASFSTVYGVSFLIVLFNAALADLLINRKYRWLIISIVLIIVSLLWGNGQLNNKALPSAGAVKFTLVQPSIDQQEKMDRTFIEKNFLLLEQLSRQATFEGTQVMVWPETAVFSYLLQDPWYTPRLRELIRQTHCWYIIGTIYSEKMKIYNSIVTLSPQAELISRYDKQHLVPFGEYLPLRKLLYPFMRNVGSYDYEYAANPIAKDIQVKQRSMVGLICFESTFPFLVKQRVKPDTSMIINLTNDAWFLDSSALYLHIDQAIFRAIENRKYFVQCANNGITALIDPFGRIIDKLPVNYVGALTVKIALP